VSSGGVASGARILAGGFEVIVRGAQADATVLSAGYEYDYGSASGTVIRSGGHELVSAGAVASGAVISNGGTERVYSGGLAIGASLFSGATLLVASGGAISGGLTLHDGHATIDGAMAAGQTVRFAGSAGTLQLDNLAAFGAAISGLSVPAEKLDLSGFAFVGGESVSWTQAGTSGTLSVHDGAKTASLTLIGTYATGDFHLADDGHGGTFVSDPRTAPSATPAATRFVEAAAGLGGGRGAPSFAVHAGGGATFGASPLVAEATSGR
jgi:autotransporter passenger strand-loop-strand repeat protein